MPKITPYRDLRVWQESLSLAEGVYRGWDRPYRFEVRGLADQMCRAATSVPANIAEGYGWQCARSYVQFLKVARGSLKALETHVLLAQRIGAFDNSKAGPMLSKSEGVGKMLNALIRSIEAGKSAA